MPHLLQLEKFRTLSAASWHKKIVHLLSASQRLHVASGVFSAAHSDTTGGQLHPLILIKLKRNDLQI